MDAYIDPAYDWVSAVIGPHSVVPWWAWLAALAMIFCGLLTPGLTAARDREAERRRLLG
ncbi:hypothetical protein AB0J80_30240 [Actinoplanes sp. NPDC049548]|uniref:hypothetical protein n=1 Tax=Actinoplanes sp. NPDC049548 TaxID=3155152 RepID=UPI003435479A